MNKKNIKECLNHFYNHNGVGSASDGDIYGLVVLGKAIENFEEEKNDVFVFLNDDIFHELWEINQEKHYYNAENIHIPMSETVDEFNLWKQYAKIELIGEDYSLNIRELSAFSSIKDLESELVRNQYPLKRTYLFKYVLCTDGGTDQEALVFSLHENLAAFLATGQTVESNL